MKKFWLHPATQIISYISLFLLLIYGTWMLLNQFVVMPLSFSLMLNEILQSIYCLGLLYLYVVFIQKRQFLSTGIVKKGVIPEISCGFALGFIVSGGAILGMYLLSAYRVAGLNWHANLLYPFVLFFFAAVVEEVVFRIFVFQTCERKWGTVPALVIASILFGLVHMVNTVDNATVGQQLMGCVFLVFEAGFLLNAVFLINRRIWLPLGMHWAWNFFEGPIFGTIVSGQNFGPSLITAQTSGSMLASGGPFGPEGSVPGLLVGVICGAVATWYSVKKGAFRVAHENSEEVA
ncbi:MAG TPA: type II CAAX endopeptidase family protein [Drouetiella sp.]